MVFLLILSPEGNYLIDMPVNFIMKAINLQVPFEISKKFCFSFLVTLTIFQKYATLHLVKTSK